MQNYDWTKEEFDMLFNYQILKSQRLIMEMLKRNGNRSSELTEQINKTKEIEERIERIICPKKRNKSPSFFCYYILTFVLLYVII